MPRTPEENERIRRAARDKILQAATELFIEKGFHSASIDDVAKRANISKGLLYNYFKGKEELLAAMVDLRIEELLEVMQAAAAKETPAEQLRLIVEGALDNVRERPEVFRFYLNLFTCPRQDEVVARHGNRLLSAYAEQFEAQCEMFEKLGAPDPRKRSLHFSSTLQGIMLMYTNYPAGFPLDDMRSQTLEEFCGNRNLQPDGF
ncbi:TetR/AcrR family transcriptional regulator [Paenibacillus elgii]